VPGIKWHQEQRSRGKAREEEAWRDKRRPGEGKNGVSGSGRRREEVG